MNILLNDVLTLLADSNASPYVIEKVTGLGVADIRNSSFLFSGRSGGMVTDQHYGFRIIVITGKVGRNGGTREQHQIDRQAMLAALPINETIPVYITDFAGNTYRTDPNITDVKVEYNTGGRTSDFMIQLTAGDPLFYSTDGGDEQTALVNRVAQGGYVTPYILPVEWESGSAATIVDNNGNAPAFPVITISDSATNPSIENQATGEIFELTLSTVDGDELVIDMGARTATLNGSNILGNVTTESSWWALEVGDNPIVLDSDSGSDTMTAVVTWRNGVTGI